MTDLQHRFDQAMISIYEEAKRGTVEQQKQIEEANKDLPLPAKIHKFVNLYKVFDADDEELTRTSKLRRAFVENRYKDIVNALYEDTDTVHMDTTITYEDGREQRIKTDLRIQNVTV